MTRLAVGLLFFTVLSQCRASFESSDAVSGSATQGSSFLKSLWDKYGTNMGSVSDGLGSGSLDSTGSTGWNRNYAPYNRNNYPSSPRDYPAAPRDPYYYPNAPRTGNDYYPNSPPRTGSDYYPDSQPRTGNDYYPDSQPRTANDNNPSPLPRTGNNQDFNNGGQQQDSY